MAFESGSHSLAARTKQNSHILAINALRQLGKGRICHKEDQRSCATWTQIYLTLAAVSRSRGHSAPCSRIWVIRSKKILLQSDLAGKRSQFTVENKTTSERTFDRFFSTKHRSLRIIVGQWLPKETLIQSAPWLGGIYLIPITRRGSPRWGYFFFFFPSKKNEMHRGPSFCCGMLLRFTDLHGASGPT